MIKRKFINLSLFQKIEIYLIFLMIFFICFYYLDDLVPTKKTQYKKPPSQHKIKIETIKEQFKKERKNTIIKLLYAKSDESRVIIKNITSNSKILSINFSSNFTKAFTFIKYISHHFIIEEISIKKEEKNVSVLISFNIKYLYNPKLSYPKVLNIPNPFKETFNKKSSKKQKYTLYAIIGDQVLINHKWYKKGMAIDKYKISKIFLNHIILTHITTNYKLILKVYNDKQ